MAEGQEKPAGGPEVRSPAPHHGGPLGSSGAAPASAEQTPAQSAPASAEPAPDQPALTEPAPAEPAPTEPAPAEPAAAGPAPDQPAPTEPAATEPAVTEPASTEPASTEPAPSPPAPGSPAAAEPAPAPPAPAPPAAAEPAPAPAAESPASEPADGRIDLDKPVVVTVGASSGRRVTRVLRHANPIKVARSAGRSTHAWAKRPTGRLLIPAFIAVLLIGAAGTAGAFLVPEALTATAAPSTTPGFGLEPTAPGVSAPSGGAVLPPGPVVSSSTPAAPVAGGRRPADALAGWAQGVGTRVGIPVVAVQAYGYAELVAARTSPGCHLSWTTVAAIGKIESAHGSANGAVLGADGSVQPPILGLPLDGKGGRQLIRDTDRGAIDGDATYDRAIGPMQFIPATWSEMAVDADNSGAADPNDIDDAALTAALSLCAGGRDLSKADAWWDAILSYNAVRPYAQKVFDAANEYGRRSRV